MRFHIPKKLKLAVIYARKDPTQYDSLNAERQEAICRDYCANAGIRVLRSIRVCCGSADSLKLLQSLLQTLPPEVDTLLAVRFSDFAIYAPDLGRLCLCFQCRNITVQSLDNPGPLYQHLPCLRPEDFTMAEARYMELMRQK